MLQDLVRLAILAVLVWVIYSRFGGKVSPVKAKELVKAGALLLDVRTPGEFASGHIEGAKSIPLGELDSRHVELGTDRERPVVVYCATGMRSASAKRRLRSRGFTQVFDLGAMARW